MLSDLSLLLRRSYRIIIFFILFLFVQLLPKLSVGECGTNINAVQAAGAAQGKDSQAAGASECKAGAIQQKQMVQIKAKGVDE